MQHNYLNIRNIKPKGLQKTLRFGYANIFRGIAAVAATTLLSVLNSAAQTVAVTVDCGVQYQTMEGFAASDCWTADFVGKYWNSDKKEQIARWLFSQEIPPRSGYAEGIGLSIWRVNLGAGSAEQGDASDIGTYRRAECFLNADGSYDWTKAAGQQYFMQKAKEYGCEQFVAFANSPPVFFTKNGLAHSSVANSANLQDDKYDEYADYLTEVVKHFRQDGYNFAYISPVNEPQFEWTGTDQEGSPWTNAQIKKIAVNLDSCIVAKNIDTKIMIAEAGEYGYLYESPTSHPNQSAGSQLRFFDPQSTSYIGNLPSIAPAIAAHSYWTYGTTQTTLTTRQRVKTFADRFGVGVFQTEWSMLGDAPTEGFTSYEASTAYQDIAIFMARLIYFDIVYAGVSSWAWWTAMDMERYSQKNRFMLIALEPGGNFYNPPTMNGNIYARQNLWALGNYSLFVRPNYRRIALTTTETGYDGLLGTAYLAPEGNRIVAVYVNQYDAAKTITTDFQNLNGKRVAKKNMYYCRETVRLRQYGDTVYTPNMEIALPPRAVVTLVFDLEDDDTAIEANKTSPFRCVFNPSNGELTIENAELKPGETVQILDVAGHTVGTRLIAPTIAPVSINVSTLPNGLYFVKTENGTGRFVKN